MQIIKVIMFFCISIVLVIYYYLKNNEQIIPSQKCDFCWYFYFEIKFAKFISSKKWLVLSAVSNDKVQESMFDIRDKLAKLCSGILFH